MNLKQEIKRNYNMSIISKKNSSKKSLQSNTFIEKEEHFLHWTADKGGSWGYVSLQHI